MYSPASEKNVSSTKPGRSSESKHLDSSAAAPHDQTALPLQRLQETASNSLQASQAARLQELAKQHATKQQAVQKKENRTGLPDQLKSGIENLSGYAMDDVKVHYNSGKPAQLQAHAYAQGADIHLGPGQERHLPHEAWHVVQQKQGRVKPTLQLKGTVAVNDDAGLELEADVMGARAMGMKKGDSQNVLQAKSVVGHFNSNDVVQAYSYNDQPKGQLSENSEILLTSKKGLYASAYQIQESNKLLSTAGPHGSLIRLEKTGDAKKSEHIPWQTFYKIAPLVNKESYKARMEATPHSFHKEMNEQEKETLDLWADCRRASEVVTGGSASLGHHDKKVKVGITSNERYLGNIDREQAAYDNNTARLSLQVYAIAISPFLEKFGIEAIDDSALGELVSEYKVSENKPQKLKELQDAASSDISLVQKLYSSLKPEYKDKFHQLTRTNEYANPEVGDAYTTVTEFMMPGFESTDNDWAFHWGGVIMKDGGDNVTLENLSVSNEKTRNTNWFFAMYGTKEKEQTFHYQQTEVNQHHGSVATTITAITEGSEERRTALFEKEKQEDPNYARLHEILILAAKKRSAYSRNWVMDKLVEYIKNVIEQYKHERIEPDFTEMRGRSITRMAEKIYKDMDQAIEEEGLEKIV